ncbi:MAG TPA: DNA cytosine methyltransferase, partial [Burkholderiales bacterium]|nr:DNA cytosine methyltransferase [Burkholderiales bacterium]
MNNKTSLRVLDTFAGAGGFSLGFQLAGYEVMGAIEVDKWACETFSQNHPHAITVQRDIASLSNHDLLNLFNENKPDVIIGGPPCQGFSIANRNAGDHKDPRNSLFTEFLRIGEVLQPSVMVMENVPNLIAAKTSEGQSVLEIIKESLSGLGFNTYSAVLQATNYGVPQIRNRLFVIASRMPLEEPFPSPTHQVKNIDTPSLLDGLLKPCPTLWDAISDLPKLQAGEGAEVSSYESLPRNEYQAILRRDAT